MKQSELEAIVEGGESGQVEFKRSTGQRSEAARAVCGMLNGEGGFVFFGVTNDGGIRGQDVSAATLAGVVNELRRIEPTPVINPEVVPLDSGRSVIVVRAPGSSEGTYTYDGRPYIRVGPTTTVMPQEEYRRRLLEQAHPAHRWEHLESPLQIDDLDHAEITRTIDEAIRRQRMDEPGTRDPAALLAGLGLLKGDRLLNATGVLFGREGRLGPEYSQCLLRMALANAFCHREYRIPGGSVAIGIYDDRLEISSTGSLPPGLTPADLLRSHTSRPRNPSIASVLYRRGIIEQWGRGTLKIAELTQQAGLALPQFEERGGEVVVTFFPSGYEPPPRVPHELAPIQQEILKLLGELGPVPSTVVRRELTTPLSETGLLQHLRVLSHLGLIERVGRTRGAKWRLTGRQ